MWEHDGDLTGESVAVSPGGVTAVSGLLLCSRP